MTWMKAFLPAIALAMTLGDTVGRAESAPGLPTQQMSPAKIAIRVGGKVLTATLADSTTTRDFVSLLPMTVTMRDLFGREKSGDLPRPLSEGGARLRTYEVGDLIYWSPSDHLAIFYRHDGGSIPSPGIIVLARVEAGAEAFDVPGNFEVTIEALR